MEAYYNCLRLKNKKVRILTHDRKHITGTIVDVDPQYVYLRPERGGARVSAFYPYGGGYGPGWYGNDIITLSLFTLLAIALI
ncbi:hypothetical protein V3851_14965 [Paenibacillus sp. M1]|uniref:Cellobiose phosphorylase n=1 Tax=Paenibacillus haidiansis TaxID=1574488 RepID=A0ABU7VTV0_9BACL